jgi:hypothetical protein
VAKSLLLSLISLLIFTGLKAQEKKCLNHDFHSIHPELNEDYKEAFQNQFNHSSRLKLNQDTGGVIYIPVVFHGIGSGICDRKIRK